MLARIGQHIASVQMQVACTVSRSQDRKLLFSDIPSHTLLTSAATLATLPVQVYSLVNPYLSSTSTLIFMDLLCS